MYIGGNYKKSLNPNTKLLITASGDNIVDATGKAITKYGNTVATTAQSVLDKPSIYFDGSGDYLSLADSDDWDFGSGDFTIDFWVRIPESSGTSYAKFMLGTNSVPISTGFAFGHYEGAMLAYYESKFVSAGSININTWYHVALVQSSSGCKTYNNGVLITTDSNQSINSNVPLIIGSTSPINANRFFNGYLSHLRITKGQALWTSNFTPPSRDGDYFIYEGTATPRIGTAVNQNTKLLITGSDGIVDSTGKAITTYGNTSVTTAQSIIGGSSIYFDGVGDSLIPNDSSDFDFGTSPFTVDVWCCPTVSQTDWRSILSTNGSYNGWVLYFSNSSSVGFRFGTNTKQSVDGVPLTTNSFSHIAVVRNGDNGYLFVNGSLRVTVTGLESISINRELPLRIAQNANSPEDTYKFIGYLSHIRITKGQALWTSNFTPPSRSEDYITQSNYIKSVPTRSAYAYGVRWDTSNSSPTLTKGIIVDGYFTANNYTAYPIQDKMRRCVKDSSGVKLYDLAPTNSIYKADQLTPLRSGTATSTSAGKLVDTAANFTTAGIQIGHWIHNTTTNISTQVTAVDSATQLSVKLDRFVSGNAYSIGTANPQADGAVMVEVPATHYIMCTDGNYKYFLISETNFSLRKSDNTLVFSTYHPWFREGNVFRPNQYWGAFESVWYDADGGGYKNHDGSTITATGDKAVSIPGFLPLTNQTRPEMRTRHTAFGSNYHTISYYADEFMGLLYMTEYGTLNSQAAIPGYTETTWAWSNVRTTGRTMHLGNASGTIAGVSGFDPGTFNIANSYRGIENFYGHVWKWVDGINFNNQRIYINNNPATWADDTATNYTDTGLNLPATGYQSNFHNGLLLPSASSGSTSTYVTDYVWSAAGWVALFCGGNLINAADAGVFARYANTAGSNRSAHVGSRSSVV